MHVHLNGRLVPAEAANVSVWDGGFLYGDGIYTTLRLYAGRPLDLTAHVARLNRMAAELELPVVLDEARSAAAIRELAAANGLAAADGRLRITISRGGGPGSGMPLSGLDAIAPTVLMTLVPVGPELAAWGADGIGVIVLDEAYARGNFPTLKTLNSLATLQALRRAAAAGCPEAILTGHGGRLLEGAVSNLFLVRGGELLTPAARDGEFLAGRTRERILRLAATLDVRAREAVLHTPDLAAADEAFVASSVREVLPVVRVDGAPLSDGRPGPVTRAVQAAYRALIQKDLPADAPPAG